MTRRETGVWIRAEGKENHPENGTVCLIFRKDDLGTREIQLCLYHEGRYENLSVEGGVYYGEVEKFLIVPEWE